eukprot:51460-Chlamydomonas_euryale.AAC.4
MHPVRLSRVPLDPQSEIHDLRPTIRDPQSKVHDPKFTIRDPRSEVQRQAPDLKPCLWSLTQGAQRSRGNHISATSPAGEGCSTLYDSKFLGERGWLFVLYL